MADDGMLLNFELPTDAFQAPKKAFKGGSWKDRLTARKSAQWGRMKAEERATGKTPDYGNTRGEKEELIRPDGKPSKRPRTDDNDGGFKPARTGPRPGGRAPSEREILPKSTTGEVISSLFTYNPAAKATRPDPIPEDQAPVEPSNAPLTDELATFTNLGLSTTLASHLMNKLGLKAPTAIQRKALQQLCSTDNDAFIQAETGSGKTLSYLLPIVQRISDISKQMKAEGQDFNRKSGMFALILAPTRELVRQIETVLETLLSCCHWIVGGTVIGGEQKQREKARLRKGVNILVATPGRLTDHLEHTEVLDVSRVRWLVLDEGDRLMELGFDQDIQKIVSNLNLRSRKAQEQPIPGLPEKRNTVLCSATIKADIEQLKSIALHDPVTIAVDASERVEDADGKLVEQEFSAPAQLKQSYAIVPPKQRLVTLVAALKQAFKRKGSVMKCIVFMSCADSVDFHFEILTHDITATPKEVPAITTKDKKGAFRGQTSDKPEVQEELKMPRQSRTDKIPQGNTIEESRTHGPAAAFASKDEPIQIFRLHGSLQQSTRTAALKAFSKCNDPAVLVCTDVASRGLDLPNVDFVIEYDPPFSKEDHLHRVGRTARAGKEGRAMIFLQPGCEEGYVEILKEGRPRNLTHHDADEILKKGFSATSGVVNSREWEQAATEWQIECERWATENPKHLEQARRAYQSHIRAYTTHVAAERSIFDMKQLHLGHLAKAFALRDKPGAIRVPGLRPGKEDGAKMRQARRVEAGKNAGARAAEGKRSRGDADLDVPDMTDEQEARKKMHAMGRRMGGAGEFNLG
jgi:ATP-dependent RNA helicase DDX31/DBP7